MSNLGFTRSIEACASLRSRCSKIAATRRGAMLAAIALGLFATVQGAQAQTALPERVVTMSSMSFGKIPTDLKIGETIVWTNNDSVPHSVTARDKSFDLRVAPGRSARMTLDKAGSFPFYCIYHSTMRGTLKVAG